MIALFKSIFNLTMITLVLIGCSQTNRPLVSQKEIPEYENNHPQSIPKGSNKPIGHGVLERGLKKSLVSSASRSEKNRRFFKLKNVNYYLIGASKGLILEVLGQAHFTRVDPPAQILQFESGTCFLDLFFYKRKNKLEVKHVSIRSKQVKKIKDEDCFLSLISSRNK